MKKSKVRKKKHNHFRCEKRNLGCCYCNSCGCEKDLLEREKFGVIIDEGEFII